MQDDTTSVLSPPNVTHVASSKSDSSSSPTPPEAWGGNAFPNKLNSRRQAVPLLSRMQPTGSVSSGSVSAGLQDVPVGSPVSWVWEQLDASDVTMYGNPWDFLWNAPI